MPPKFKVNYYSGGSKTVTAFDTLIRGGIASIEVTLADAGGEVKAGLNEEALTKMTASARIRRYVSVTGETETGVSMEKDNDGTDKITLTPYVI